MRLLNECKKYGIDLDKSSIKFAKKSLLNLLDMKTLQYFVPRFSKFVIKVLSLLSKINMPFFELPIGGLIISLL